MQMQMRPWWYLEQFFFKDMMAICTLLWAGGDKDVSSLMIFCGSFERYSFRRETFTESGIGSMSLGPPTVFLNLVSLKGCLFHYQEDTINIGPTLMACSNQKIYMLTHTLFVFSYKEMVSEKNVCAGENWWCCLLCTTTSCMGCSIAQEWEHGWIDT